MPLITSGNAAASAISGPASAVAAAVLPTHILPPNVEAAVMAFIEQRMNLGGGARNSHPVGATASASMGSMMHGGANTATIAAVAGNAAAANSAGNAAAAANSARAGVITGADATTFAAASAARSASDSSDLRREISESTVPKLGAPAVYTRAADVVASAKALAGGDLERAREIVTTVIQDKNAAPDLRSYLQQRLDIETSNKPAELNFDQRNTVSVLKQHPEVFSVDAAGRDAMIADPKTPSDLREALIQVRDDLNLNLVLDNAGHGGDLSKTDGIILASDVQIVADQNAGRLPTPGGTISSEAAASIAAASQPYLTPTAPVPHAERPAAPVAEAEEPAQTGGVTS